MKFGNKLEKIDFRNLEVDQKTMLEIIKIKSLRYFTIHSELLGAFGCKLKSLAESQNQLKEIDFHYMPKNSRYTFSECSVQRNYIFGSSLNDFIEAKSKTLTHIKLNMYMTSCDKDCAPLKSLALCQNLKYFHGSLHRHDFVHFSEIPKLETLKLKCNYDYNHCSEFSDAELITMFQQMDLTSLKHLSIRYKNTSKDFYVTVLERVSFPALERLYIHPDCRSTNDYYFGYFNFKEVVENLPSLKMVQFGKAWYIGNIKKIEFCFQILEERGILVQFECSEYQRRFERLLQEKRVLDKYQKLKLDSLRWSEIEANRNSMI